MCNERNRASKVYILGCRLENQKTPISGPFGFNRHITGYIWDSSEKMITHKALIQNIITECKPQMELAKEMEKNWKKLRTELRCKLEYDENDAPRYKYLRCKKKGHWWSRLELTEPI